MRTKEALIITHIQREQPATILNVLKQRGWQSKIISPYNGDQFPSSLSPYGVLIVMGGPQSAKDTAEQTPWMPNEISLIQQAIAEKVPYLGVCLGVQTLVQAAGGKIVPSPRKEVGFRESYAEPLGKFYTVQLTPQGIKDPLFEGLPDTLPLFHLHGEAVEFTDTMNPQPTLLATAEVVPNQIIKIGKNAYGTQGHFELTPGMLEVWLRVDPDLLALGQQGEEQVRKDYQQLKEEYNRTGRTIFNNFFQLIEQS